MVIGKAAKKTKQFLDNIAEKITANDKSTLLKIAKTSMQTKLVRKNSDQLAEMVVKAVLSVAEKNDEKYTVDIDDIKVEKKSGGSINDSAIVQGIVLDKEIVHSGMPNKVDRWKDCTQ